MVQWLQRWTDDREVLIQTWPAPPQGFPGTNIKYSGSLTTIPKASHFHTISIVETNNPDFTKNV